MDSADFVGELFSRYLHVSNISDFDIVQPVKQTGGSHPGMGGEDGVYSFTANW